MPISIKKLLYYAHTYSHLTYGCVLWGPMLGNEQIKKIEKIVNKIIMSINNIKKTNNYLTLYKNLKLLHFNDIIELEVTKLLYKIVNNLMPDNIKSAFDQTPRHYNTRNRTTPRIAQHNTNIYNNSFLAKGIILYTQLPENIKNSKHLKQFVKTYKKFKLATY